MRVLKVTAQGEVTSFRYPHFMLGVQPTYEMPPPSTIYGHVCSVLGELFDPGEAQFAVHFTYQERFKDIEHTHLVASSSGKLPDTSIPKVQEGNVNPLSRELLFKPRLTLYLNRPEWYEAFLSPRYPVALGRSQDLFTYTSIEVVELAQSSEAYFEHTLAPFSFAQKTARGLAVLMPRYLDYKASRFPSFERYIILKQRISSADLLQPSYSADRYWIDPSSPIVEGRHLGLIFHKWVDTDGIDTFHELA